MSLGPPLVLVAHTILVAISAALNSPASDEVAHLPAGIVVWTEGRFDLYRVNPPLVRAVAALPVVVAGRNVDAIPYDVSPSGRPEWKVGREFISANGPRAFAIWKHARWACVPLSLLGAYICLRWASELFGPRAGMVAATLWCFSPNIIGNASMITPDVGATSLGLCAAYTFARWLNKPTVGSALVSGLAFGLAQLSKMSWVILFGLWPLLFAIHRLIRRPSRSATKSSPQAWQLMLIIFIGWDVLNCGYLWQRSFSRLREYEFQSQAMSGVSDGLDARISGNRFAGTWLGHVPMPLPWDYVVGMDLQKRDFEEQRASYLRGEFRQGGWWYYYLYALLVKVPLGTWVLFLVAVGLTGTRWFWRHGITAAEDRGSGTEDCDESDVRDHHRPHGGNLGCRCGLLAGDSRLTWCDTLVLLAPAVTILVFVSANTGINRHMRYVLPAFPFVMIWISQVACVFRRVGNPASNPESETATSTDQSRCQCAFWLRALVAGALAWSVASSLVAYPHSGSYFNEVAGGPANGWKHLNSSNIDWGQGLLFLQKWLDDNPEARPLYLVYYGQFDPRIAGIEFELPPRAPDGYVPPTSRRYRSESPDALHRRSALDVSRLEALDPHPAETTGPVPGWHAISVHMLAGSPAQVSTPGGRQHQAPMYAYSYYQEFEPIAMAGYSFCIYHITLHEANRVRRQMGLPELVRAQ